MTPEHIAREAAEGLFHVARYEYTGGEKSWEIWLGIYNFGPRFRAESEAKERAKNLAGCVEGVVLAAIERALAVVPVPGGISEGRLAEIRERAALEGPNMFTELAAHVAHLTRALHDCGQDGTAAVWSAGYEAGQASRGPIGE